ncbi:MAG: hypothetical protein ACRDO2_02385 [Nocardioidaceae bacterium]
MWRRAAIPARYTCDDVNVAPRQSWTGDSGDAAATALVVDDPDAGAHHYRFTIYALSSRTQLDEGVTLDTALDAIRTSHRVWSTGRHVRARRVIAGRRRYEEGRGKGPTPGFLHEYEYDASSGCPAP